MTVQHYFYGYLLPSQMIPERRRYGKLGGRLLPSASGHPLHLTALHLTTAGRIDSKIVQLRSNVA